MKRVLVAVLCLLGSWAVAPAGHAAPAASCRAGGATFALPFRDRSSADFAQLSTTRGGTWAGVAYDGTTNTIHLISWRPRQRAVSLFRISYRSAFDTRLSVVPAGITPAGAVVAAVQKQTGPFVGRYWLHGKAGVLRPGAHWLGWQPTAVSDSGRVVGYATLGNPRAPTYYAVTWASVGSAPTVLAKVGDGPPSVLVTGAGDIVWTRSDSYVFVLPHTGGPARLLVEDAHASGPSHLYPTAAGRTTVFAAGQRGLLLWNLARAGAAHPSVIGSDTGYGSYSLTAGARGDLAVDLRNPGRIRLASGATATLPAVLFSAPLTPFRAVDAHGTVAYTARTDRLVHFATCR